jgi:hypothetical protein
MIRGFACSAKSYRNLTSSQGDHGTPGFAHKVAYSFTHTTVDNKVGLAAAKTDLFVVKK